MNDLTNSQQNFDAPRSKPNRATTEYEQRYEAKKAFRVRQQEDKESKLALEDFRRHYREEQDAIRRERARGYEQMSDTQSLD